MNNVIQLVLNISVLLYGMAFLLPFAKRINSLVYFALSWFVGWGVVSNIGIILVVCGIGITLFKIVLISFILLLSLMIVKSLLCGKFALYEDWQERSREGYMLKGFLFFAGMFACFIYFANYVCYTTDTLVGEGLSRVFHNFGTYASEKCKLFYVLLNQRLPLYISVQNIARLAGIERYSSFSGVTVLFLCSGICGFWKQQENRLNKSSKIWLCGVIGLLVSNCMVFTHIFVPLSNIITMGYFSLGILCLYSFIENKNIFYFVTASFLLGCTAIIRKEMLFFALLPFIVLVWQGYMPNLKERLFCLLIYILPAFLWYLWGISKIWTLDIVTGGFKTGLHGGYLIVLLLLPVTIGIFLFPRKLIRNKIVKSAVIMLIAVGFVVLAYYCKERVIHSISQLLSLMFCKKGRWGIFWSLAILGFLLYVTLLLFVKLRPRIFPVESFDKIKFNLENRYNFILFTILSFLVGRIILCALFTGPKDTDFWSSGNRILIHVYPAIVYFLGRIGYMLEKISNDSN